VQPAQNCSHAVMDRLRKRYAKVTSFANSPTPQTRAVAAALASFGAIALTYILLGLMWGAGTSILWLCAIGAGVAAGYAAATTRWALGAIYGVIAAIWVLLEALVALLGVVVSGVS